jgi:SAM-dependent methyltransferase
MLKEGGEALSCLRCGRSYPVDADGIVSFLPHVGPGAASWDEVAEAYAASFSDYTAAVEVTATVGRLGRPAGPVLDHGAGTGRMTAALFHATGRPVVALDYSRESLRRLLTDCRGLPVLAVHADARQLPLRDEVMGGICSAGVHPLVAASGRRRMLAELARVLQPAGPLVLSTLNYSWVFRAWRLKGNPGAKIGDHLYGRSIHYERLTARELRAELAEHFTIQELVGVRNLPARTFASAVRSVGGARAGKRVARWVEHDGPRLDRQIERLPISRLTGFLLLARAERRQPGPGPTSKAPSSTPHQTTPSACNPSPPTGHGHRSARPGGGSPTTRSPSPAGLTDAITPVGGGAVAGVLPSTFS